MTTDPIDLETKPRRFTLLDGAVLALAICALAAPFAMRMQVVKAHAGTPQVAVRAEVSSLHALDVDLGYKDRKPEAAFFEGLGQNPESSLEEPVELALNTPAPAPAEPTLSGDTLDHPLHSAEETAPLVSAEPEEPEVIAPHFQRDVAILFSPLILDVPVAADTSDEPPAQTKEVVEAPQEPEEEEAQSVAHGIMTAPPTLTPVPKKRPFHPVTTPITTVSLADQGFQLPIDVTPPLRGRIEEVPLPPIDVVPLTLPRAPAAPQLAPRADVQVEIVPAPAPNPEAIETVELSPLPTAPVNPPSPVVVDPQPRVVVTPQPMIIPEPQQIATATPQPIVVDPRPSVAQTPEPVVTPVVAPPVAEPAVEPVEVAVKAPQPARPVARISNGPRIALVIAAAGLNENVTQFAIDALPAGITLAFAPVKEEAGDWAREAKQDGHTVLVEIPLEPVNRSRDPGPLTLRVADSPRQNIERLDRALAVIPVADGASSYLGARFNAEERAVGPLVSALASRNLMLFENEPTARSRFQEISARAHLPYAAGIVKFDRNRSGAAIRASLDALEKQARRRGSAVGVGTALRSTISTVALWAKEAEKRGVRLVPITEVAR